MFGSDQLEKGELPAPVQRGETGPVNGPLHLTTQPEYDDSDNDKERSIPLTDFLDIAPRRSRDSSPPHSGTTGELGAVQANMCASLAGSGTHRDSKKTKYIRLPLLARPLRDPEGPWLRAEDAPTTWLSLFYDLAVGAVLCAFNGTNSLQTADAMPSYFAYYVIVVSIWTTQIHYDIRYEADDSTHRLLKPLHLMLFVYIGAASGGWDLSKIVRPNYLDLSIGASEATLHDLAADSFLTVAIAISIHRALMCGQYLMIVFLGKRASRPTTSPKYTAAFLALSCVLSVIAATLTAKSHQLASAKIGFLYASVFVDLFAIFAQAVYGILVPLRWHTIAERYGALTLIILGLGFSKLTAVFQTSLAGVGQGDTSTYVNVFIGIGIMYCLWSMLFANFRQNVPVEVGRTWLYEILHFPLHFCMLLLLIAVINTVSSTSFAFSVGEVGSSYVKTIQETIANMIQGLPLDQRAIQHVAMELGRLDVTPTFEAEVGHLQTLIDELMLNATESTEAIQRVVELANLESLSYLALIIYAGCQKNNVVIGDDVDENLAKLYLINQNSTAEGFNTTAAYEDAERYYSNALLSVIGTSLSGSLWLFPAAGVTMILCALRSMTCYRFRGAAHWVVHGLQVGFGLALALLGLLDIGSGDITFNKNKDDVNLPRPMFRVLNHLMGLPTVFIVYAVVVLGSSLCLEGIERRDQFARWFSKRRTS